MVIGGLVLAWVMLAGFVLEAWSRLLSNDRAVRGINEDLHAAGLDEDHAWPEAIGIAQAS